MKLYRAWIDQSVSSTLGL